MLGASLELLQECLTLRSVYTSRDFVQKPLSEAEVSCVLVRTTLNVVLRVRTTLNAVLRVRTTLSAVLRVRTTLNGVLRVRTTLSAVLRVRTTLTVVLRVRTTLSAVLRVRMTLSAVLIEVLVLNLSGHVCKGRPGKGYIRSSLHLARR